MRATTIIERAAADGLQLTLSPAGSIRAIGDKAAVARWAATIREHKPGIVAALQAAANDAVLLDIFAPVLTSDPDVYGRWRVTIPGRDPLAVIVVPPATVAQMQVVYPGAASIIADAEGAE